MSKLYLPKSIKMVITDFDGVLTDGCVYISDEGVCSRKINFQDVMAINLLKKAGFEIDGDEYILKSPLGQGKFYRMIYKRGQE